MRRIVSRKKMGRNWHYTLKSGDTVQEVEENTYILFWGAGEALVLRWWTIDCYCWFLGMYSSLLDQ